LRQPVQQTTNSNKRTNEKVKVEEESSRYVWSICGKEKGRRGGKRKKGS
jgi:hypothetical protein